MTYSKKDIIVGYTFVYSDYEYEVRSINGEVCQVWSGRMGKLITLTIQEMVDNANTGVWPPKTLIYEIY